MREGGGGGKRDRERGGLRGRVRVGGEEGRGKAGRHLD